MKRCSFLSALLLVPLVALVGCASTQPYQTEKSVTALDFSPDGRLLAVANAEEIRVLEAGTGKLLRTLREVPQDPKDADPQRFRHGVGGSMVFLDNDRILTTGMGGLVSVWDVSDGSRLSAVDPLSKEEFASTLDYSAEANRLVIGTSNGQILLADISADRVRNPVPIASVEGYVLDLQLSRGGRYFAAAFIAPKAARQSASTDEADMTAHHVKTQESENDGTYDGVSDQAEQSNVVIWDAERREKLGVLEGATRVFRMELMPGEPTLLTAGEQVKVWEFLTRLQAEQISDPNMVLQAIGLGTIVVVSVASLSLGALTPLSFADSAWNTALIIPPAAFIRHACSRSVAISPDGRTIVSTTLGPTHNVMAVIDRPSNKVIEKWTADIAVCDMQFSPDGNFLVTATSKGAFRYDTTRWKKINLKDLAGAGRQ